MLNALYLKHNVDNGDCLFLQLIADDVSRRLVSPQLRTPESAVLLRYVARFRRQASGVDRPSPASPTPRTVAKLKTRTPYNSYLQRGGWGGGYGK